MNGLETQVKTLMTSVIRPGALIRFTLEPCICSFTYSGTSNVEIFRDFVFTYFKEAEKFPARKSPLNVLVKLIF